MHDMQRWAASMAMCPDRRLTIPDRERNPETPQRMYIPFNIFGSSLYSSATMYSTNTMENGMTSLVRHAAAAYMKKTIISGMNKKETARSKAHTHILSHLCALSSLWW
jgi:hypothetical protein